MTLDVPQTVLDALTDVDMPRLAPVDPAAETLSLSGFDVPVYRAGCVVIGSGAAGLRAAVEAKRRGNHVVIVSQSAWGGTSACSGSDKQTLHTANTADRGDDFKAMARAIRAGGAMDEDTAYVEAVGSARMMASLQFIGLPLPQDAYGGTLRYQTDHDEVGRATSCGPRTSRLMVQVLAREALQLAIPFFNQTTGLRLLTEGSGDRRHIVGLLATRAAERSPNNPYGFALFACGAVVLAAGGPGELYRDSVYPNGCFGALGLALQAGLILTNLTESQFGIGTRREGFPWNLSGTYVQALPHIYALDTEGREHHFLADYYRTTQEMASNIFRKGYQWPFHAERMLDFGSSLIDLAIVRENALGRRVLMDFNRNPLPVPGDLPFDLGRLDDDVRAYLGTAGATQASPIERLRHMNPLAIELYRRYKFDIAEDPLEFAVNNQHMNGGVMVDIWGRSTLSGCYAVGEAAGTHGVTRPGGAALNAGQVFGTRAAEHLDATGWARQPAAHDLAASGGAALEQCLAVLRPESPLDVKTLRTDIQARMSDSAGLICRADEVAAALEEAHRLNTAIRENGIAYDRPAEIGRVLQWHQMALASEAVLTALDHFIRNGGGSRGARAICDPQGALTPHTRSGPLEAFRFRAEEDAHRGEQILVFHDGTRLHVATRPNRRFDEAAKPFFERDWPAWLTGALFDVERKKGVDIKSC
ncbi:oxidoreductase [Rhizobium rhizosphaerae]|uniref:Oxidoreductase n=1 Tax=Xaviernesmea rhizosphaerae TaxID=1672749 RepID=A0ABX3PF31_9HYPH|nr:FAD-binding protein [Xaviernesmea rhizosphaerae]OQP86749.1 oxidoreductase [Xaviernesmea rhizosphaerae]